MSVAPHAIIPVVGEKYGPVEEEDIEVFFRLGVNHYKSNYGSGDTDDPENNFFPGSLMAGPRLVPHGTSPMAERRIMEIASSCALLSLLSYRHDDVIIDCMQGANPRMLPDVWFFSLHTLEESDLSVFVSDDQSWAVFCFRGTEPETLRDWWLHVCSLDKSRFLFNRYLSSESPRATTSCKSSGTVLSPIKSCLRGTAQVSYW